VAVLAPLTLALVTCANKNRTLDLTQQSQAPSDSVMTNQVITELHGDTFKKKMTYPYLTVRFEQNDTEVEMMLDPQSTNLALELQRTPDGSIEVSKGDSVLLEKQSTPASDSLNKELDTGPHPYTDNLTDEIMAEIQLAQKLFYEERFEEALDVLRSSIRKKETATAYALGGSIYYVNGDIEGALRAWDNALKINPELYKVRRLIERHR
jgi:tetratricopeptide (TPR) repeat protein